MYYNMPLYNVALDPTTGIYTAESIDIPTGSISEVNTKLLSNKPRMHLPEANVRFERCKAMHLDPPSIPTGYGGTLMHYNPTQYQVQTVRHNGHVATPPDVIRQGPRSGSSLPCPVSASAPASMSVTMPGVVQPSRTTSSRGRCEINYCRTWSKRRRDQRLDQSSASSQRTDSNSSASATVDENLNERKSSVEASPPPTPYSPLSSHIASDLQVPPHHQHPAASYYQPQSTNATGGGRRNRRNNTRRQATTSTTANASQTASHEVGAGDAPLPDHSDVCVKMDNLKL